MTEKHQSNWVNGTDQYAKENPGKSTEAAPSNALDQFPPWSTIEDPPEYNAENAKSPKDGSDWLGGPQNGDENTSEATMRYNPRYSGSENGGNGGNGGNG